MGLGRQKGRSARGGVLEAWRFIATGQREPGRRPDCEVGTGMFKVETMADG
jgi:hypothetical protein